MIRIVLTVMLTFLATSVYCQMYKWTDKDGKVHYSDKPPPQGAGQLPLGAKPTPARIQPQGRGKREVTFNIAHDPRSPVLISAKGAQAFKQGDDIEVLLPNLELAKNIDGVSEVEVDFLECGLFRRKPDGSPELLGECDRDKSLGRTVRGKLSAQVVSFRDVRLKFRKTAAECQETCLVVLSVWVGYGNLQTRKGSSPAEIRWN